VTKTIMIVDDDPNALKLYDALLRRSGELEVIAAQDAAVALRLRTETLPDLFIIDVLMPGVNGIELCRHLRNHSATAHTPILILSALGRPETIAEALQAGANDFVIKPSTRDELEAKIHSLLGVGTSEAGV
jgi:DNA-binding response OmpR family regulator